MVAHLSQALIALLTAAALAPLGCASSRSAPLSPSAASSATAPVPPPPKEQAPTAQPAHEPWLESVLADHPLTGRIYRPADGSFVTRAQVAAAVASTSLLMLGEKHDNRDHHRLQAEMLRAFLDAHPGAAVAFEMLDVGQQPAVDKYLDGHPSSIDGLADAVAWGETGWPEWTVYRPVFQVAFERGAPIVAANLPRDEAMSVAREKDQSPILKLLSLPALPQAQLDAMSAEMKESHCGALPERMIPGMVLAQRARDATIAAHVEQASAGKGAALITGNGHARKDRGVPVALAAVDSRPLLTIAFVEVYRGEDDPAAYVDRAAGGVQPYDYVWFTPRVDEKDPCEQMRMPAR